MLSWASTQMSEPILEGFGSISYHFRDSWSAFNVGNVAAGVNRPLWQAAAGAYFRRM